MSSCDSRLSSKAWGSVVGCQPPSAAICCKVLPALTGISQARKEFLRESFMVFCLATLPASAASQFRTEDLFWKTAVLHSHHVASPSDLGHHDQDLNTWLVGTARYLLVVDSVLPGNAQEPAEAAEVELVQFLEVSAVACPGLSARQQGWEDYSSVDSKLRCLGDTALTPNSCPQAPKCTVDRRFRCQGHQMRTGNCQDM